MNLKQWIDANFDTSKEYAFITGASSGIGYEYLKAFACHGCRCIVLSEESELLTKVSNEITKTYGVEIIPIVIDLSNISEVQKLKNLLKPYKITALINNAGFGYKGTFLDMEEQAIINMVNVNSLAPTLISRYLLNTMRDLNKGLVVSVATINIVTPIAKNCIYTASKFYTWAYSLAMFMENSDKNIYFQTLLPGTTDTPFHIKQGAKPSSLTMSPKAVMEYSIQNLHKVICIPNKVDRFLFPFVTRLPIFYKMKLASVMLKKRLGV